MGETLTLQQLMKLQKTIWTFKVDEDTKLNEKLEREQLKSFDQISRICSFAALPILAFGCLLLYTYTDPIFLVFILLYTAVSVYLAIKNYNNNPIFDNEGFAYKNALRHIKREAMMTGTFAGLVLGFPMMAGQLPLTAEVILLEILAILICCFLYGSIPSIQRYCQYVMTACYSIGMLIAGGVAVVPLVVLFIFSSFCIGYVFRLFFFNFAKRHIHAIELKNAADTVRMLLNDYSEHSSDWLWEIDNENRIVAPSARFAETLGLEPDALAGGNFVNLFDDSTSRNALSQSLKSSQPFRDMIVPISINNQTRWWKLSGRAVTGSDGSISKVRGVASDITSAKNAEDRVAHLAHFDSLTDLPNRALFDTALRRVVAKNTKGGQIAVLYVDLDHFKTVNDTMGHGAGDLVLKAVARRLDNAINSSDIVARLGGDEFAVLLHHLEDQDEGNKIAENLIDNLSEPIMIEGYPVTVGASIGIAYSQDRQDDIAELLKNADIALYRSKQKGRGCYTIFENEMRKAVQDRRTTEMDLRTAIKNNDLALHYQPLINIETQETIGYEALVRWDHPTRGLIMPDAFIPIAEDSGLIVQLGEWVIRTALNEIKNWPEHLCVAVNLSPSQLRSPNLIATVVNALAASEVDPGRLELEITESVLMNESEANVALLHKIRSLGVRIALDDFGTGYSSLNYLRSFPFDKIKIDRCFVEDVDSREDCRAIIRAVTGLASSLGMITTAEGVERSGQLKQLKEEGCEQVQGYFFAKAMPAEDVVGRNADDTEALAAKPVSQLPVSTREVPRKKPAKSRLRRKKRKAG